MALRQIEGRAGRRMTMNTGKIDKKRAQEKQQPQLSDDERREKKIDRDLADSFPASDPPGWTSGVERRKRKTPKPTQR